MSFHPRSRPSRGAASGRSRFALSLALAFGALGVAAGGTAAANPAAIHPSQASIHTREIDVEHDGFGAGTAKCPSGKVAISGGAAFHRPGAAPVVGLSAKVVASGPTQNGRGWHGAGAAFEDDTIQLRVTVVCLAASKVGPYTVRTRDLPSDESGNKSGALGCGKGMRVVAGGFIWNPGAGGPKPNGAQNMERSSPTPDGLGWVAEGFSYGPDDVLRIVLLCRPVDSVGGISVHHRDVAITASDGGGIANCPSGQRALGGGVDWFKDGVRNTQGGSVTSSSVRANDKGWFVAASAGGSGVRLRITVLCIPA